MILLELLVLNLAIDVDFLFVVLCLFEKPLI